ncbi:hypothetical protein Y032_0863g2747, partial [Ancylostoma ceylanicum]
DKCIMANKRRFGDQNYVKIKKTCVKKGQLFVDTLFPPTNASLFLEQGRSSDIVWKRPAELHNDPHLFVEGASPNDVTQGILGNCWFVSACSALTHNQHLLNRVIPDAEAQEWDPKNEYAGVFRFRFWRFGSWVEVVIDDLLPTRDGKLLFARSKTPNEFWSALLEKAFANIGRKLTEKKNKKEFDFSFISTILQRGRLSVSYFIKMLHSQIQPENVDG